MSTLTIIFLIIAAYSFVMAIYRSITWTPLRYTVWSIVIGVPLNLALITALITTVGFTFPAIVLMIINGLNMALLIGKYEDKQDPLDGAGEWFFYLLFMAGYVACALAL